MDQTTFITIILTAIITTAGTAIVTWQGHRLSSAKDRSTIEEDRTRHAQYLAIRVVTVIDRFVSGCSEVMEDKGWRREGDMTLRLHAEVPTLVYPEDVDWKSLPPSLMYSLLALPTDLVRVNAIMALMLQVAGPDEFIEERQHQFAKIGLKAYDLAETIRAGYAIPPLEKIVGYDTRAELAKTADRRRVVAEAAIDEWELANPEMSLARLNAS